MQILRWKLWGCKPNKPRSRSWIVFSSVWISTAPSSRRLRLHLSYTRCWRSPRSVARWLCATSLQRQRLFSCRRRWPQSATFSQMLCWTVWNTFGQYTQRGCQALTTSSRDIRMRWPNSLSVRHRGISLRCQRSRSTPGETRMEVSSRDGAPSLRFVPCPSLWWLLPFTEDQSDARSFNGLDTGVKLREPWVERW